MSCHWLAFCHDAHYAGCGQSVIYASIVHSSRSTNMAACVFLFSSRVYSSMDAWFVYRTSTTLFNFSIVLSAAS